MDLERVAKRCLKLIINQEHSIIKLSIKRFGRIDSTLSKLDSILFLEINELWIYKSDQC
jgi:hypothetical protein